jgi:DNA helicase IV
MLSKSIEDLRELLSNIRKYRIFKFVGYILTPVVIGYYIVKKVKPKLENLEKSKEDIFNKIEKGIKHSVDDSNNTYKRFCEEDTYLIYDVRNSSKTKLNDDLRNLTFLEDNKKIFETDFNKLVTDSYSEISHIKEKILTFNEEFVKRRKKEYAHFFKRSSLTLDDDQQTAIVTDEKHNLVVAGAGSGKTEVLITRIAYLIQRKPDTINPSKILALAFQNKAAAEVRERLKSRYKVDVEIRTFHSLGQRILQDAMKQKSREMPQLMFGGDNFESKYKAFITSLFKKLQEDKIMQNKIVNFMKFYGDDQIVKEKTDFKTKEEFYKYQRGLTYRTLDGTEVKSEQEREIMNFFITHNVNGKRINILYEEPAEWMKYKKEDIEKIPSPDFFFPDFKIYLEHWAIGKNGKVPEWFEGDNPTEKYTYSMNIKKEKFESQKEFLLMETTSGEFVDKNFNSNLKQKFLNALKEQNPNEDFSIEPISYEDLVKRVWEECREFIRSLSLNISRFIVIAKTYSLEPEDIEKRLKSESWSKKQEAFTEIAIPIYKIYQGELKKGNFIDYSDMINLAVKELKANTKFYKDKYEHILIDEYQDISTQRYELVNELMKKNDKCKLFCVGDDWQSIMGFAGSNLDFFVNFEKYFDHPARTDLTINYRSVKSIVETGAQIIKHNKDSQLVKKTIAKNGGNNPLSVYSSLHQKEYFEQYYRQIASHAIDKMKDFLDKGYKPNDIMILCRISKRPKLINAIMDYARSKKVPISTDPRKKIAIPLMSVHRSKGLQARVVFILNVDKDLYGFPCELESPEVFEPAIKNHKKIREEEERRLFYVAVTRAKEEVIVYNQKCSQSKFITEIKDYIKREDLGY